jgi:hypothetical protein
VLSDSVFKTKCIVEYLKKTVKEIKKPDFLSEKCVVIRSRTNDQIYDLVESKKNMPMSKITIEGDKASIEDFNG